MRTCAASHEAGILAAQRNRLENLRNSSGRIRASRLGTDCIRRGTGPRVHRKTSSWEG
jgi:hypothetical protein